MRSRAVRVKHRGSPPVYCKKQLRSPDPYMPTTSFKLRRDGPAYKAAVIVPQVFWFNPSIINHRTGSVLCPGEGGLESVAHRMRYLPIYRCHEPDGKESHDEDVYRGLSARYQPGEEYEE